MDLLIIIRVNQDQTNLIKALYKNWCTQVLKFILSKAKPKMLLHQTQHILNCLLLQFKIFFVFIFFPST